MNNSRYENMNPKNSIKERDRKNLFNLLIQLRVEKTQFFRLIMQGKIKLFVSSIIIRNISFIN